MTWTTYHYTNTIIVVECWILDTMHWIQYCAMLAPCGWCHCGRLIKVYHNALMCQSRHPIDGAMRYWLLCNSTCNNRSRGANTALFWPKVSRTSELSLVDLRCANSYTQAFGRVFLFEQTFKTVVLVLQKKPAFGAVSFFGCLYIQFGHLCNWVKTKTGGTHGGMCALMVAHGYQRC